MLVHELSRYFLFRNIDFTHFTYPSCFVLVGDAGFGSGDFFEDIFFVYVFRVLSRVC